MNGAVSRRRARRPRGASSCQGQNRRPPSGSRDARCGFAEFRGPRPLRMSPERGEGHARRGVSSLRASRVESTAATAHNAARSRCGRPDGPHSGARGARALPAGPSMVTIIAYPNRRRAFDHWIDREAGGDEETSSTPTGLSLASPITKAHATVSLWSHYFATLACLRARSDRRRTSRALRRCPDSGRRPHP